MIGRPVSLIPLAIVVVLLGSVLAVGAAAQTSDQLTDATDATDSAKSTLATASQTPIHYATGGAVGAGIGLIIGSFVTYQYWRGKIG